MKSWNFSTQMNNNPTNNQKETTLEFQWKIFRVRIQEQCIVVSWICVRIRKLSLSRVILLDFSVHKSLWKMHHSEVFTWIIFLWFFKVVLLFRSFLTLSLLHCFTKKRGLFWLRSLPKMLSKHTQTLNKSFKLVSFFNS